MRIYLQIISKKLHRTNKNVSQIVQRVLTLHNNSLYLYTLNLFLVGCITLFFSFSDSHADWDAERDLYIKARYELIHNKINQFSAHKSELTDYPLFPYLVYVELTARMSSLSNKDVDMSVSYTHLTLPTKA